MDIDRLAGTKLGNHEIESLLGRGGMGVVYKARQISLDRPVALKILPPALSSDISFVKRFQREARAVAKLSHPNIMQVFDIAEEQGLHFFSMEYVQGRTLDQVLKEKGRLDFDEAAQIITQAAQGIEHAHENKILHRDIKPSNIILDRRGNVKVMDFGLARIAEDPSKLTQSGTLMGTLDYMSPEQCRGEELGSRTDIYSLGVVLYEMLTGRVPFDAPNEAALIYKIVHDTPADIRALSPDVPPILSAIVERATAKDKEDRYPNISEFLKDVRSASILASPNAPEEEASPSIAVLPFADMSYEKDQEYFCDGIAEELINALTQLEDLRVIARTSAFSFKDEKVDVHEIGKRLNVQTVLEGSVRKAGNRLRITAQLVDTSGGHHLWSERYDRNLGDVFAIQDEITVAIVDKLRPKLLKGEKARLARRQTVDLEAYSLYLKGRFFWNKRTEEGLRKAIEYFEKGIEIDPEYALLYAGLADTYSNLPFYSASLSTEVFPLAKQAALKALQLDDALAEAHASLAFIKTLYDWDWEGAEREFRRAIELNPGYATAHHWYAIYLAYQSRFDEAISEVKEAVELDPLSLTINAFVGMMFSQARQYDRAIAALEKTLELDPGFLLAHRFLGLAYLRNSRYEEALEKFEMEKDVSRGWNLDWEHMIGVTYALMGRKGEAQKVLDNLKIR
ncbi:MAG: protein kinase, partial [Candidatus Hydrogenedentota bacterium]